MNEYLQRSSQNTRMGEYQESKALSEIKGKMVLARQFPRNPDVSLQRVLTECNRPELAQCAQYEFPRGDSVVKGPSIRLVEVLARNWENLVFGVDEIEVQGDSTTIKAFAWDLETNVSDEKTFSVKHERSTKTKTYKLTDSRDIYEAVANQGARRKRACILSVLPGWYVEAAVDACEATLKASMSKGKSIDERRQDMVVAFEKFGITAAQISEKIGKEIEKLNIQDLVKLSKLYSAIDDGFVKPADAFGISAAGLPEQSDEEAARLESLNDSFARAMKQADDIPLPFEDAEQMQLDG